MVLKVVTMAELRFDVLFEPERTGETVADVCRRYEISRDPTTGVTSPNVSRVSGIAFETEDLSEPDAGGGGDPDRGDAHGASSVGSSTHPR